MASSRKPTRSKINANTEQFGFNFPRGYWLHFFLGLLAAYSLYLVIAGTASRGHLPLSLNITALLDAGTSSLLVSVFGVLFLIYAALKRSAPIVAKVCAYILVILATLALIATFVITSRPYYTQDDFYLVFTILFHNPWVAIVNSVVSIIGIITVVAKLIQRNR